MSRKALIRLDVALGIIAVALLAIVAIGASGIMVEHEFEQSDTGLLVSDKPLLTDEEKALARETGVARYRVGMAIYFDPYLPSEYYEEAQ